MFIVIFHKLQKHMKKGKKQLYIQRISDITHCFSAFKICPYAAQSLRRAHAWHVHTHTSYFVIFVFLIQKYAMS